MVRSFLGGLDRYIGKSTGDLALTHPMGGPYFVSAGFLVL